jgi:membrane protease YdiL (CAAX protease family)
MENFLKGIYEDRPALVKLGILLFLIISGAIFSSSLFQLLYLVADFQNSDIFFRTHFAQIMSSIFMLILPCICTAFLCSKNSNDFLYIRKINDWRLFLLAGSMILFVLPAIQITAYLNEQIVLPEFMSTLEEWMRQMEDSAIKTTNALLSQKGIFHFSINILVIAVLAGISEELLFRSALFSILKKKITNPHLLVWLAAIIFSFIHFQFYGFIPRLLLGALLGYLLIWTNNIWIPVFAHFLHNALTITYSFISDGDTSMSNDKAYELIETNLSSILVLAVASLVLFFGCVILMKKICLKTTGAM